MSSTHTYCPFHINQCVSSVHDERVKVSYDANCVCMVEYMINKTHRTAKRFTVHNVLDNHIENTALLESISYTNEVNVNRQWMTHVDVVHT